MESSGQWLERALLELCNKIENGLDLDADIISGLVSYCELAPPLEAKEYLDVTSFPFHPSIMGYMLFILSVLLIFFSCVQFFSLLIWVLDSVESP